jgi:divalent anion:Na+ symporter, DASS family
MDHLVAVIQSVPLFAELPRDAQARLLNDVEETHKAPGQFIIKQGDTGDALYVVVSGLVEVQEEGGRHVEQVAVFGPGDWFGEMALRTGEARSASVIALSSCQLLRLDKPRFDTLCQRHPSVLQAVARALCYARPGLGLEG